MGLVVEWGNLSDLALPFFLAITVSGAIALFLRRASEESGLPRARERCVHCQFERALVRDGYCRRLCAVNDLPSPPLVLFLATSTIATVGLLYPAQMLAFVLPFAIGTYWTPEILLGILTAANAGAAVILAAYFVQDLPRHRELFAAVAIVGTLIALFVGATATGPAGSLARLLTPVGLALLLLFQAVEHRSRMGRPALGLRAIGASTVPLFLVVALALVRIGELMQFARFG